MEIVSVRDRPRERNDLAGRVGRTSGFLKASHRTAFPARRRHFVIGGEMVPPHAFQLAPTVALSYSMCFVRQAWSCRRPAHSLS